MAKRELDINIRLDRQEKKILKLSEELQKAQEEYRHLQEEKRKNDMKKIGEAYHKSGRTLEEVLNYLKGKSDLS